MQITTIVERPPSERDTTKVIVAPYDFAVLRCAKSVERQIEFEREDMHVLQTYAGARRRDIAHMAWEHRALPLEMHQSLP